MSFFASAKYFTDEELNVLEGVYVASCEAAGIAYDDKDDLRRDTVAHLVMALAVSGENDPQVLFNRTLMSLRIPA